MRLFILFIGKLQVLSTSHWYEVPNTKIVFKELYKSVRINLYTDQLLYCLQLPLTPCRCA